MNRVLPILFAGILLTSVSLFCTENTTSPCCNTCCFSDCCDCDQCCLGPCDGYPFLQIRSQGRNSARQMVGQQEFMHLYDIDSMNGVLSLAVEYSETFWPEKISRFYFGKDLIDCCALYVQGSQVEERKSRAWLADYFGLPTDYDSKITFCPKIKNVVVDLDFYLGLDEWSKGVYFRMNLPVVWTKWELCMSEKRTSTGGYEFPTGYMAQDSVARDTLPKSFTQAMSGEKTFGDMKTAIKYGLIKNSSCTKAGIAEIDFTLGWNFVQEEDSHFGFFVYVAAPTGNKPCATHLFEPIIGNGKHWELGGGLSGSWIFYRNEKEEEHYLGMYMEAIVAHLFRACQCRSFDFCCKPNSRYMLLAQMGSNDQAVKVGANTETVKSEATYQYKRNLIPAINWSTFRVDVKIDIQADIALKLGYTRGNFSLDLGYNLYARTGERFCCNCCNDDCCGYCNTRFDNPCHSSCCGCGCDTSYEKYAIKGDSYMYGIEDTNNPETYPIPFSQTSANIYKGKNVQALLSETARANAQNDNILLSWSPYNVALINTNTTPKTGINASELPVLVTRNMLNIGKSPSMITHKIFAHLGYAWKETEGDWAPFIGIGGEIEFAQDTQCCWDDCCNSHYSNCCKDCLPPYVICDRTTKTKTKKRTCDNVCKSYCDGCSAAKGGISQWGIWIKGGITFD